MRRKFLTLSMIVLFCGIGRPVQIIQAKLGYIVMILGRIYIGWLTKTYDCEMLEIVLESGLLDNKYYQIINIWLWKIWMNNAVELDDSYK